MLPPYLRGVVIAYRLARPCPCMPITQHFVELVD